MSDLLRIDYINSLPQPFAVQFIGEKGDSYWSLIDICVETGLLHFNACGLAECKHISDVRVFIDEHGNKHEPDTFYSDYKELENERP